MKIDNELIAELGFRIFKNGNVRRHKKPFKCYTDSNGYPQINVSVNGKTKSFSLHRLLAQKFIPNPQNKPEVNHRDGVKRNSKVKNLEWATRSENIKHGIKTGLIKKSMVGRVGNKHFKSKSVQKFMFGVLLETFESTGEAARLNGFNAKSIQDACKGRLKTYKGFTWKYV